MRSSHYLTRFLPLLLLTASLLLLCLRASSDLSHLRPLLSSLTEKASSLHAALLNAPLSPPVSPSPLAENSYPAPPAVPIAPPRSAPKEPSRSSLLLPGLAHAIQSFSRYSSLAHSIISRKESRYLRQSPSQLQLAHQLGYHEHFERTRAAVAGNTPLTNLVAEVGREHYGLSSAQLQQEEQEPDYGLVDLAFGHLSRDWTTQGAEERAAVFPPILEALEERFGSQFGGKGRKVLVPGSGMGRLASDIADLGYETTANELDYGSILFHHLLLNSSLTPSLHSHSLQPFPTKWTHQLLPLSRYTSLTFPDHPPNPSVKLVEGDFLKVFGPEDEGTFDAVVTLFFIDMSESCIDFLLQIHRLLKPGGLWINLGPLKWGTHSDMQLSLAEVLQLSDLLGFEVDEGGRKSVESVYASQPDTLLKFTYVAQFWTATKRA